MYKKLDYKLALSDSMSIKGIAICMMLVHHLFLEHREYGIFPFKLALICKACVAIFVFLSGYGLTIKFSKINTTSFKEKLKESIKFLFGRYKKIYLNYWPIFIATIFLGSFYFGRTLTDAYGADANIIQSLIMDFFGLMQMQSYNATWWFIRLILTFYLVFPILFYGMKNKVMGICLLVFLFWWPTHLQIPFVDFDGTIVTYLKSFGLGIFLAHNVDIINKILKEIKPQVLFAISLTACIFLCCIRNIVITPSFFGQKIDPFLVLFIYLTFTSLRQFYSKEIKPLVFLGKHSMNIFLTHTLFSTYFFSNFIYGFGNPILIFIVLLAISLVLSIAIEFCKEKTRYNKLLQ